MADTCKTCRFSVRFAAGLTCRRFPPVIYTLRTFQHQDQNTTEYENAWAQPIVDKRDWCGEHKS